MIARGCLSWRPPFELRHDFARGGAQFAENRQKINGCEHAERDKRKRGADRRPAVSCQSKHTSRDADRHLGGRRHGIWRGGMPEKLWLGRGIRLGWPRRWGNGRMGERHLKQQLALHVWRLSRTLARVYERAPARGAHKQRG